MVFKRGPAGWSGWSHWSVRPRQRLRRSVGWADGILTETRQRLGPSAPRRRRAWLGGPWSEGVGCPRLGGGARRARVGVGGTCGSGLCSGAALHQDLLPRGVRVHDGCLRTRAEWPGRSGGTGGGPGRRSGARWWTGRRRIEPADPGFRPESESVVSLDTGLGWRYRAKSRRLQESRTVEPFLGATAHLPNRL